jgi:hypothetical protein
MLFELSSPLMKALQSTMQLNEFFSPKALGNYNLYIIKAIEINRGKNHNAIQ